MLQAHAFMLILFNYKRKGSLYINKKVLHKTLPMISVPLKQNFYCTYGIIQY